MYIIFITSPFPNFLRPDSSLSSALVVNLVFEETKPTKPRPLTGSGPGSDRFLCLSDDLGWGRVRAPAVPSQSSPSLQIDLPARRWLAVHLINSPDSSGNESTFLRPLLAGVFEGRDERAASREKRVERTQCQNQRKAEVMSNHQTKGIFGV